MKLATVNVIEYANDTILGAHSFSDDNDGSLEAEELFKKVVQENGDKITDEEMEVFLEDGYFENGGYQAFLTHSN